MPGPSTHFCAIFLIPNKKIFPDGPVFQDKIFFKFLNTISSKAGLKMPDLKSWGPEPEFVSLLRSPGSDSQPGRIDSSESISGLLKGKKLGLWQVKILVWKIGGKSAKNH